MILYINDKNEIKDVNITSNDSLTPIQVGDDFVENYSKAKLCCYKLIFDENNEVIGLTNYIKTNLLECVNKLGKTDETAAIDILDTQVALTETFEKALSSEADITDIQLALVELYEMITGGNE